MSVKRSAVEEWLQERDDAQSEVSGYTVGVASEFGEFDEDVYCVKEEVLPSPVVDGEDAAAVEVALGEVARGAQRKTVCGFYRHYARGRMLDFPDYTPRVVSNQLFFQLQTYMQISSLDDSALVDALSSGVVRARLGAETALGKTFRLPGLLAQKCGLRVCQVELDASMARRAMAVQRKRYGIAGGLRSWSRQKKPFLCAMSYKEFRGVVLSGNCRKLFEDFDLFYYDEASESLAAVYSAKQSFAKFCQPHNSLLVVSATVSTEPTNNEAARAVGKFTEEREPLGLEQALDSGRLLREHLRDRTLVLVPSDEQVAMARAYYEENGVDVYVLDSASTYADEDAVTRALSVTSAVVPRVLVATVEYGVGYNFPVSYVVTTATRRVYELDASNALVEREVPLMEKTVIQHKGRTARGLAVGSGGWVLSAQRAAEKELLASEALEAYLSLVAAGIRPRPGLFDSVTKVLPKGIDAEVARRLLRTGLPPALAVRYLGSDGRFAAKYVEAVQLFSQTGETFRKSRDELPWCYEEWVEETVGGYYVGDESATSVRLAVPFACPEGLKVQMHAISAVAEGLLQLDYWNWYDEDEESDDEVVGVRLKVRRRVKPRMPDPEFPRAVTEASSATALWQYGADPGGAARRSRRHGISWSANGEGRTAVLALMRSLDAGCLGESQAVPQVDVPEYGGRTAFALPVDESFVSVQSPGGGRIMLVSTAVYSAFMAGAPLTAAAVVEVLQHLVEIKAVERFVKSTVFDNWSPAWLCWFLTYTDTGVVEAVKVSGLHSVAMRLLGLLYSRFHSEVLAVAASSNLYKEKLSGFFRSKPSLSKFASAVRKGKLPVAQSDAFVKRVLEVKDAYDTAVLAVEGVGLFVPGLVTSAQKRLPIRDANRRMPVIDEAVVGGASVTGVSVQESTTWRR